MNARRRNISRYNYDARASRREDDDDDVSVETKHERDYVHFTSTDRHEHTKYA